MKIIQAGKYILMIIFVLNMSCSKSEKSDEKLNGKSINFLIEKLGSPDNTVEFILTKELPEYRYGLLKYYPEPEGKNIHIKELIWESNHKKTVIWFHNDKENWVSIDNLTWNPDKIKY